MVGFKSDEFNGKDTPRLEFDIDFNHVANVLDTDLNFNVDLGELAEFAIEESNLGISAQADAQFDFIVLLQVPGSEPDDKIATKSGDEVTFDPAKKVSELNAGGDLMSAAGKDLRITLSDGSSFDVDLDSPRISNLLSVGATHNADGRTKAQVTENAEGDLTNKITFSGIVPALTSIEQQLPAGRKFILSLINRTDGKERTDRFTIDAVNAAAGDVTVSPTPTAGEGSYDWAIDEPPVRLTEMVDRINDAGKDHKGKFELTANDDLTGFKLIDKTADTNAVGGKLKVETLGTSKAAVALGIAGVGHVTATGDPIGQSGSDDTTKAKVEAAGENTTIEIPTARLETTPRIGDVIQMAGASLQIVKVTPGSPKTVLETDPSAVPGDYSWKIFRGQAEIIGAPLHGKSLLDNAFIRNLQIDVGANLNASIDKATARLGPLELDLPNGSGVARLGAGQAFHDPGPTFDGRVTLKEATKAIGELKTRLRAQNEITFPLTPPDETLSLVIKGQDTDLKLAVGEVAGATAFATTLNNDEDFKKVATAILGGEDEVVIKLGVPFDANQDVDGTKITIADHSFEDGDAVTYSSNRGTAISDFMEGETFYIVEVDGSSFGLAESKGGSALSLTDGASELHTLSLIGAQARLTINQSTSLGLSRNEVHFSQITLKPVFPLPVGAMVNMTVSRDDRDTTVDINFNGSDSYQDMAQLLAFMETELASTPLSVSHSGSRLTFHLNNGRAHIVEILAAPGDKPPFPALGFTEPLSGYLVRPLLDGSANFDLPFTIPFPIPRSDVTERPGWPFTAQNQHLASRYHELGKGRHRVSESLAGSKGQAEQPQVTRFLSHPVRAQDGIRLFEFAGHQRRRSTIVQYEHSSAGH